MEFITLILSQQRYAFCRLYYLCLYVVYKLQLTDSLNWIKTFSVPKY